jgi:AcrR family transcriptional regulator
MASTPARAPRTPAAGGAGARPGGTRPYLRAEDRRRQLLDVATRIAGREGVESLTIVGLVKAAGVSRQLVYDHFQDRQGLVRAVLADRFTVVDNAIYASISRPGAFADTEEAIGVALEAARAFLELSREDRHILRSVLTATDAPDHELNKLALQLRERSIKRWLPVLGGDSDPGSRARAWAVTNALAGIGDLVSTGELDADRGHELFAPMLRAIVATAPPPRTRRKAKRR